ncbi:MAG: riboflavin synthase [Rhodospirillaceae bacterium]|nr:riboflavin synthase [Rhodospirillaceae bacterium]MBL6941891.1 riboflavin synthase [Rhodospirillales bacterium]
MFTGIITDIGTVRSLVKTGDTRIEISTAFDVASIDIGASICCSGACMTVIERAEDWFGVEASAETLSKTVLGSWTQGTRVNLERALRAGDEMGGHVVSGHVDGTATLTDLEKEGDSLRLSFKTSNDLKGFIAPKGSITLDGVSLTVNEVDNDTFGVNLIAHTQKETTFGNISTGDIVNVEIDMLARYVARLLEIERS